MVVPRLNFGCTEDDEDGVADDVDGRTDEKDDSPSSDRLLGEKSQQDTFILKKHSNPATR